MKKRKTTHKLTYLEKINALNDFYEINKDTDGEICAYIAKKLSLLFYKAIKLQATLAIDVLDDIFSACAETYVTTEKNICYITNNIPIVEETKKIKVVNFKLIESQLDRIEIINKYLNHELNKKEANTTTFQ